jgi:flagellin-like protein
MKANQKFRNDDEAVSPVIAVILMVAITVVLAATVYVWVSGFGTQSSTPAKTMSLSSGGALLADSSGNSWKNYTVSSATSGMKWTDVKLTLNGNALNCYSANANFAGNSFGVAQAGAFVACNSATQGPATVVGAGDRLQLFVAGGGLSGQTLRILDSQANSVILTLVVG